MVDLLRQVPAPKCPAPSAATDALNEWIEVAGIAKTQKVSPLAPVQLRMKVDDGHFCIKLKRFCRPEPGK
jgi:hypothetical protein